MKQATILIPDISGYTSFLTKTELSHSTHIINELLQVVADTITPRFTLAEIEGDALLTYAEGRVPQSEIEAICAEAFKNFHYFLKVVERDSVCRCGACNSASQLTLKFIVHYGAFEEVKIAQFTKLSGPDMIVAHRLLKNSIVSHEYLLLTKDYAEHQDSNYQWENGIDTYDLLGQIPYQYTLLDGLKKDIPNPETREDYTELFGLAKEIQLDVNAPLSEVHAVLTDNSEKLNFVEGLQRMEADSPINRVGSTHVCEFDGDSFDFVTLQDVQAEDSIVYIERAQSAGTGFAMLSYFELKSISEDKTRVSFRALTADRQPIPEEICDMVYGQTEKGLGAVKSYVESKQLV